MLTYEEWLEVTGREDNEDSYWEYLGYVENAKRVLIKKVGDAIMNTYYPMATYDGKTDNFHTLTTYDSLDSEDECLDVIGKWISIGYKIDKCWIQLYMDSVDVPIDIDVKISPNGTPYVVTG